MSVERTELEARAARHAALGDPARLRIVDLLTLGDLAPRELQDILGMPSNLIAHHLGVLEREGMILRRRSEADRRRSYVRLSPGALDQLDPAPSTTARRVLFVCTANSVRSRLAMQLWAQRSTIPAASAGTHPAAAIPVGAIAMAQRHGLPLPEGAPQQFADVAEDTDLVVTVCDAAHEELDSVALHWSIPDPGPAGTDAAFDATHDELTIRIDALAARITAT